MLGLDSVNVSRVSGGPASVAMPTEWRQRIFDITAEGNHWLADAYDLPVARHGYFG